MLVLDPSMRARAQDVVQHPWMFVQDKALLEEEDNDHRHEELGNEAVTEEAEVEQKEMDVSED